MVGARLRCFQLMGTRACSVIGLSAVLLAPVPALAGDFWTRDTLTGDWGGLRTHLADNGIDWSLTYTGEVFVNTSGGLERGATYEDLFDLEVDADLETLIGWKGAAAHITLYQIDDSGRNANDLVGAISDPSNIDALPTFRLYTLYLEQSFGDKGSLRIGQLAADSEFAISETAADLINGTFGWENFASANLPGGGPGYPLATPGVRLKWQATEKITALGVIFNGNPAGNDCPPSQSPERCDYHGTLFSLDAGALYMAEVQYRPNKTPKTPGHAWPPETVYRFGGWYHDDGFQDLGDPSRTLDGNWLLYGIADQTVWNNGTTALSVFARAGAGPANRNIIPFYAGAGFAVTAPLASRPDDILTFGVAYSDISDELSAVENKVGREAGQSVPVGNGETVLELTYVAQVTPWWSLQPDLQYIINPRGDADDPNPTVTNALDNSFLIGLRTDITF